MTTKSLLQLANTIQAAKLVKHNIKKKPVNVKDITELGVANIVGTSLLKANADLIGGL